MQLLGGGFYLLNKIFLLLSEHARAGDRIVVAQRWRIASWTALILGLPAWIAIFVVWHNWIAAAAEVSGAPAMVLGLVTALRGTTKNPPRWLDWLAIICIPLGFGYSLYDFGGITSLNQWLEIGVVLGFLVGTYLLAKEKAAGYLGYMLVHVTCGWLMLIQEYPWLFGQQMVSLVFIAMAYRIATKRKDAKSLPAN